MDNNPLLVLASTSRFRRSLLARMGLPHDAKAPSFEEDPLPDLAPKAIARVFAESKARSIQVKPGQWVIGADQVLDFEGRLLRKTETIEECRVQLLSLAGRTHSLHTSVVLWSPDEDRVFGETVTTTLTMRPLSAECVDRYLELEKPIGSVGGYFFEGRGIVLFEDVIGGEESAIVGLSLLALGRLLRQAGLEPLSLML